MNRRLFLKSAGAIATVPMITRLGGSGASAQAPMYQGEVIYTFTDFAGPTYDARTDGRINKVSLDGLVVGRDLIDGRAAPCTWNLSGERTVLDTGALEFGAWDSMAVSAGNQLAGTYEEVAGDSSIRRAVSWSSGTPALLPSDGAQISYVRFINDAGTVAGRAGDQVMRWSGAKTENLQFPEGAASGMPWCLDPSGAAYVTPYDSELNFFGQPLRWNSDGSIDALGLPEELASPAAEGVVTAVSGIPIVFDNGDFLFYARWSIGEQLYTGSGWLNSGGQYTPLLNAGAPTNFWASAALSPNLIAGISDPLGPESTAALWSDGAVTPFQDITVLPGGTSLHSLVGMTADGTVVFTGRDATETLQLLVLRPV